MATPKQGIAFARGAKQKVICAGWLRKQGGRYKTLRTRWFEVKGDQLYYYKDNTDLRVPMGVVPIPGNQVIRHPPDPMEPGKFKFEIVAGKDKEGQPVASTHNTFVLISSSAQEMELWISAINRVLYAPFGGGMFGRALAETVKFESRMGGGFVPIVVEKCVNFIRENGLKEEGLFRLPGQVKDIAELKEAFNRGENPELKSNRKEVHAVASLLKQYLRELPEPLIPYDFFEVFLTAARCHEMYEEDGILAIQKQLKVLPQANYNLLKFLCRFLFEVQEHSQENKMGINNLATVFGPNILRSGSEDPQVMMECSAVVTQMIGILIRRHVLFFPRSSDEHAFVPRQQTGAETHLIDFSDSSKGPVSLSPTGFEDDEGGPRNGGGDEGNQMQDLENELELQQQQIKDLRSQLEKERKIREMLVIRLSDEQRARVNAEERLEKLHAAMDEFATRLGGISLNFPQTR